MSPSVHPATRANTSMPTKGGAPTFPGSRGYAPNSQLPNPTLAAAAAATVKVVQSTSEPQQSPPNVRRGSRTGCAAPPPMIVQSIFDKLSLCFGSPGGLATVDGHYGTTVPMPTSDHDALSNQHRAYHPMDMASRSEDNRGDYAGLAASRTSSVKSSPASALHEQDRMFVRKRQGRALGLELHDREWDALFQDDRREVNRKFVQRQQKLAASSPSLEKVTTSDHNSATFSTPSHRKRSTAMAAAAAAAAAASTSRKSPHRKGTAGPSSNIDLEIGYAEVLAKAREAARPAMHDTPKKGGNKREDIFRVRTGNANGSPDRSRRSDASSSHQRADSLASLLLRGEGVVAKGLCFAADASTTTTDIPATVNGRPPSSAASNNFPSRTTGRRPSQTVTRPLPRAVSSTSSAVASGPTASKKHQTPLADDDISRCDETLDTSAGQESLYMQQDDIEERQVPNGSQPRRPSFVGIGAARATPSSSAAMPLYNHYKLHPPPPEEGPDGRDQGSGFPETGSTTYLADALNSEAHSSVHMKTFGETAKQLFRASDARDKRISAVTDENSGDNRNRRRRSSSTVSTGTGEERQAHRPQRRKSSARRRRRGSSSESALPAQASVVDEPCVPESVPTDGTMSSSSRSLLSKQPSSSRSTNSHYPSTSSRSSNRC